MYNSLNRLEKLAKLKTPQNSKEPKPGNGLEFEAHNITMVETL